MRSGDELVRIDRALDESGGGGRGNRQGLVGFEDIEASELLVDYGKRLELFGLEDLLVEPGPDFILFDLGKLLVIVVDVSEECQRLGSESQDGRQRSPV